MASDKPNIILILSDDLGYECLGCYGGESYRTPVLDGLSKEGMRFDHAYVLPLCTPTRLQLMTGKYNFRNWRAFGVMDPQERTFGHLMQAAGYKTCISGKWQIAIIRRILSPSGAVRGNWRKIRVLTSIAYGIRNTPRIRGRGMPIR